MGILVGNDVGTCVGAGVGNEGAFVGEPGVIGASVGFPVGDAVGTGVGAGVGAGVGEGVISMPSNLALSQ